MIREEALARLAEVLAGMNIQLVEAERRATGSNVHVVRTLTCYLDGWALLLRRGFYDKKPVEEILDQVGQAKMARYQLMLLNNGCTPMEAERRRSEAPDDPEFYWGLL